MNANLIISEAVLIAVFMFTCCILVCVCVIETKTEYIHHFLYAKQNFKK